jgi:hypothetical protein
MLGSLVVMPDGACRATKRSELGEDMEYVVILTVGAVCVPGDSNINGSVC